MIGKLEMEILHELIEEKEKLNIETIKESNINAIQNEIERLKLLVKSAFFEGVSIGVCIAADTSQKSETWQELWENTFSYSVLELPKTEISLKDL